MNSDAFVKVFEGKVDPVVFGSATKGFGPQEWAALGMCALEQATGKQGLPGGVLAKIRALLDEHMPAMAITSPDASLKSATWTVWSENVQYRAVIIEPPDGPVWESCGGVETLEQAEERARVLFGAYKLAKAGKRFRALTLDEKPNPWLSLDDTSVEADGSIRVYSNGDDSGRWYNILDVKIEDKDERDVKPLSLSEAESIYKNDVEERRTAE